jgi:phage protein D
MGTQSNAGEDVSRARIAKPSLTFNGKNVDESLKPYLTSVTYVDPAEGESDSITVELMNRDLIWLKDWYPQLGDAIEGTLKFIRWNGPATLTLPCGSLLCDTIMASGWEHTFKIEGVSQPINTDFDTKDVTKTWKDVTLAGVGNQIAGKYGMSCEYNADEVKIKSLEQTEKTDCKFLEETVKEYGLCMKIYKKKIRIFDKGKLEEKGPVKTITLTDMVGGEYTYKDSVMGVYDGAEIKYKNGKKEGDTLTVMVSASKKSVKGSRMLKISQKADDEKEARRIAAAKVNESNEKAETMTTSIWPDVSVVAGVTVQIQGFGHADGKYFVDKVTWKMTGDGKASQDLDMHKCQPRIKA